jgi:hypothetical protein
VPLTLESLPTNPAGLTATNQPRGLPRNARPTGPCQWGGAENLGLNRPNRTVSEVLSELGRWECLVAGMAAGADSIEVLDLLRHGAMPDLFGGIRAPSTLGSHLRSFTRRTCAQLEMVNRLLLDTEEDQRPVSSARSGQVRGGERRLKLGLG